MTRRDVVVGVVGGIINAVVVIAVRGVRCLLYVVITCIDVGVCADVGVIAAVCCHIPFVCTCMGNTYAHCMRVGGVVDRVVIVGIVIRVCGIGVGVLIL